MQSKTLFVALLSSGTYAATTHKIVTSGLTFSPNVIIAERGDTIEFRFGKGNHSVVAGAFSQACAPVARGFFSGHFPVSEGQSVSSLFFLTIWLSPLMSST
jgi:plastocyanin